MSISRGLYRLLLKLHPRGFRSDFESEMLWIFDEVRSQRKSLKMFCDCLSSLVRQHANAENYIRRPVNGFGMEVPGFEIELLPFLRATIVVTCIVVGFISGLGHFTPVTLPSTSWPRPRVYWPSCEDFTAPSKPIRRVHSPHPRKAG
jgi:hypothetical protein